MFRNMFRLAVAAEIFLTRNNCNLKRLCPNPASTKCFGTHSYLTYPNVLHSKRRKYYFLLGGILTFLGLKRKEEEESDLIMAVKKGILYMKRGQFEKAETTLHDALKMANEEKNEDGINYVYDILANLFFDIGQWKKAEKLFIDVFKYLMKKGYELNDDKLVHISLKLAKIYEMTKAYVKAESGYMHCIKVLEKKVADMGKAVGKEFINNVPTLQLWITTLDSYARFLLNQSRAKEALEYFKVALHMSVKVYGRQHENTALLLNDLGTASYHLGDLDSAISYTKEAADIGKNIADMENLSIIYINLGYLYLSKELYKESRITCEMGMKFAKKEENKDATQKAEECLKEIEKASQSNMYHV